MKKTFELRDKKQTGRKMHWLIKKFCTDLSNIYVKNKSLAEFGLKDFFDYVKNIPYLQDVKPIEIIARPKILLSGMSLDCKKKAILMSCWCVLNGFDYRLATTSSRKDKRIHHVFCQAFIDKEWKNLDSTYNNYELFDAKTVTKIEFI